MDSSSAVSDVLFYAFHRLGLQALVERVQLASKREQSLLERETAVAAREARTIFSSNLVK